MDALKRLLIRESQVQPVLLVFEDLHLLMQAMKQATAMERGAIQERCSLVLGEAHALAEGALAHARAHQERSNEAYALHLLGEIAARREPPEGALAEAHYQQAHALAEELGMRPLVAHCHIGLGMLYAKMGQREQAHAELSAAIEIYRAMDMTFWLPQAEAALAQIEERP